MFIIGATDARYGEIVQVIDAAKGVCVEKVGIVTEGMQRAGRGGTSHRTSAPTSDPKGRSTRESPPALRVFVAYARPSKPAESGVLAPASLCPNKQQPPPHTTGKGAGAKGVGSSGGGANHG